MDRYFVCLVLSVLVLCSCTGQPAGSSVPERAPVVTVLPGETGVMTSLPDIPLSKTTLSNGALSLTVLSPADGASVAESPLELIVISNVETVFTINGDLFIIPAGKESAFLVSLEEGYNFIELVASDYQGDEVETVLTVIYDR